MKNTKTTWTTKRYDVFGMSAEPTTVCMTPVGSGVKGTGLSGFGRLVAQGAIAPTFATVVDPLPGGTPV